MQFAKQGIISDLYMSSVCHSYVLVCHPYVTRKYWCVIRMSLVFSRMSSVCHSYILLCHPYVTCLWFYHEPIYMHYAQLKKNVKFQIRKKMTNSRVTKIRFHSIKIAILIKLRFHDVFVENLFNDERKNFLLRKD